MRLRFRELAVLMIGSNIWIGIPQAKADPLYSYYNSPYSSLDLAPKPGTHITATTVMQTSGAEDDQLRSRTVGFGLDFNLKHSLADEFRIDADAIAQLETGAYQSAYSNEFQPYNGIRLGEAAATWDPIHELEFKGGAINQSFLDSPLLLSPYAFPAVFESAKIPLGSFYLIAGAEQAIPTSELSSSGPSTMGDMPALYLENLHFGYQAPKSFTADVRASYFNFRNLSTSIASASRYFGNTVAGYGDLNSTFAYGYDGVDSGLRLSWDSGGFLKLSTGAGYLVNLSAPGGQNLGELAFVESEVRASRNVTFIPRFDLFHNESDSAPALYTEADWGHNNRQGAAVGLGMKLMPSDLLIQGQYVTGSLINPSPFQSDFSYFQLSLRKAYEIL